MPETQELNLEIYKATYYISLLRGNTRLTRLEMAEIAQLLEAYAKELEVKRE